MFTRARGLPVLFLNSLKRRCNNRKRSGLCVEEITVKKIRVFCAIVFFVLQHIKLPRKMLAL